MPLILFLIFFLFFNALIFGMLCLVIAPIYILLNYGVLWGLLAMYLLWPVTTIILTGRTYGR